jgi:hypothetical protein
MKQRLVVFWIAVALLAASAIAAEKPSAELTEWVQLTPAASPTPRAGMAMAYDAVSGKIVLFGGVGASQYFGDTWAFDGVTWTQLTPALSPPARAAAGMTFDAAIQKLVMFGGYTESAGYFGDTWIFDGTTGSWHAADPSVSPPAVTSPSVFTDPRNGRADVYGGFDGTSYRSGTWQFKGTTWLQLQPPISPTARAGAIAALDYATKSVVLSQGLADGNAGNTWTWDGANWMEQSPAQQPPLLYNAAAAFDPKFKVVVACGGGSRAVDQNGTWGWTGTNWLHGHPGNPPPPREFPGMANGLAIGHVVIFGGVSNATFFGDTWELRLATDR